MKELISQYISEWGWITAVAIISFTFKDLIGNFVIGAQFLWGNDFNVDDIVYIKGAKKARIVRQNIYKTTFYVFGHERKFVVPNNRLWTLEIEKEIPKDETPENFPII
jgi:hypothetical protein